MKNLSIKRFLNKIFYNPKFKIKGKNNIINIHESAYTKRVRIHIFGNNNTIQIEEGTYLHDFKIIIGFPNCPIENCTIKIGKKTSFNSAQIQIGESNSQIDIGPNCRFAHGIEINCTDHHSILDENGQLLNKGEYIKIGEHVWVCRAATIMKNTTIPNGCVVATRSVVTKNFDKENCIIAGCPAKIVKENIRWDRERPQNYINKISQTENL
ncbi:acyltransferase [bacterium]|nr:acyltransferase [bacterium]